MKERPDNEWFAQQLGERWQTTGDGIYRLDDESSEPAERDLADDLEWSIGSASRDESQAGAAGDARGTVERSG